MSQTLTDPRTELVLLNSDDIHHLTCDDCWVPRTPMLCGLRWEALKGIDCPDDCGCPSCPLCEEEWVRHLRSHRPWWKRWLP
jgi:hypothetical protein